MKSYFFAFVFILINFACSAQSLQRQSISPMGCSSTINQITFSQTVGQIYGTNTNNNNETIYRPGFQQPVFKIVNIRSFIEAKLFPNPTTEAITIENENEIVAVLLLLHSNAEIVAASYKMKTIELEDTPKALTFVLTLENIN